MTGAAPLLRLGPVRLGPGPAERSHAVVPQLALFVEPLTSLVYRQAVLRLHLEAPRVSGAGAQARLLLPSMRP